MNKKGDINIGIRAAREVCGRTGDKKEIKKIMSDIGCDRRTWYEWCRGVTPNGSALQKLAFAGYDVVYILTGNRRATNGPETYTV